jgi:hypothetical protein
MDEQTDVTGAAADAEGREGESPRCGEDTTGTTGTTGNHGAPLGSDGQRERDGAGWSVRRAATMTTGRGTGAARRWSGPSAS